MWSIVVSGATIGMILASLLRGVVKRGKAWPFAVAGALIGGLAAYSYESGRPQLPAVDTVEQFRQQVLEARGPVVVEFYTDSCVACRMLAPTLESLASEFVGKAQFVRIDADQARDLSERYDIQAVPTVILFVTGVETRKWVGAYPAEEYRAALNAAASK